MDDEEITNRIAEEILGLRKNGKYWMKNGIILYASERIPDWDNKTPPKLNPFDNLYHLQFVKNEVVKRWGSFNLAYHDHRDGCGNHYVFGIDSKGVEVVDEDEARAICIGTLQAVKNDKR